MMTKGEDDSDAAVSIQVLKLVKEFYTTHTEIKASHGLEHVLKVYDHTIKAIIASHEPPLDSRVAMEIGIAALLHDVDDSKYFPKHSDLENARSILHCAGINETSGDKVLQMIDLVSCSKNGNHVPESILHSGAFHLLIPRWADRLEAVGAIGVVRCYQYTAEHSEPLSSNNSPRAVTEADVWEHATPVRFQNYLTSGGKSDDMISHYYDKLLHVACPPKEIVRNSYLEDQAQESSKALVEMCIRYGKSGVVDTAYVHEVARALKIDLSK